MSKIHIRYSIALHSAKSKEKIGLTLNPKPQEMKKKLKGETDGYSYKQNA